MLESVEVINKRLEEHWGLFESTYVKYRVVFSDNEVESRTGEWVDTDASGNFIRRVFETRQVKKYPWIQGKYVLEQLTVVPEGHRNELTEKLSYEPLWVFEDKNGNALPPKWEAIEIIVDTVLKQIHGTEYKGRVKYKDPYSDPKTAREVKEAEIDKLTEELFGNETEVGDALANKDGIVVPRNYNKEIM